MIAGHGLADVCSHINASHFLMKRKQSDSALSAVVSTSASWLFVAVESLIELAPTEKETKSRSDGICTHISASRLSVRLVEPRWPCVFIVIGKFVAIDTRRL
jgi:hypothetical protein